MVKRDKLLDSGACFELAFNFSWLSDGILDAANAFSRKKTEGPNVALIGIASALRSARELKKVVPSYRGRINKIEKRLEKMKKEIHEASPQKPLTAKRQKELMYGLYRMHSASFKDVYTPGRRSCGLPPEGER